MSVCAVVGGQFGSEGKGLIVGHIAREYGHHVRVGAANAGHTLYTQDTYGLGHVPTGSWSKHVMQQLPCAAYGNPDAVLYIGPGALISPPIFDAELAKLAAWCVQQGRQMPDIFVDYRAHVITQEQIDAEQETGLAERIGSTSTIAKEGIGTAAADRVLRAERCVLARDFFADGTRPVLLDDVPRLLRAHNRKLTDNYHLLLEGTQGTGLSITTGDFPYCTSRNTTATGLAADAGVAGNHLDRVILVCRTYPIRVAGPSGPFAEGSTEIDWAQLGIDEENERTTVTKKVRRVATFSVPQVVEAVQLNGATEIALTFADYLDPSIAGRRGGEVSLARWPKVQRAIDIIEETTQVPVTFVGTGPHSVIHYNSARSRLAAT